MVENDGTERFICALCARPGDASGRGSSSPPTRSPAVTNGRVRPARADSDAFWRALKDKDAEIERLESLLARAEAEKQELAAQLAAGARRDVAASVRPTVASETAEPAGRGRPQTVEFGADPPSLWPTRGAGRRRSAPSALAASWRRARRSAAARRSRRDAPRARRRTAPQRRAATALPEHTDPRLGEALRRATATRGADARQRAAPARPPGSPPTRRLPAPGAAAVAPEPDELVPLTILQRGVDLLNVSAVPKRVVETNENLGIPQVHVGAQDESTLLITFMWTMGWYQFRVELADAGRITLADRGYEERVDLRPNASARTDGTVQLAPSQIKPPTPKDTSEPKPAGVTQRRDHLEVDDGPAHRRRERAGRLEVQAGARLRLGTLTAPPGGAGAPSRGAPRPTFSPLLAYSPMRRARRSGRRQAVGELLEGQRVRRRDHLDRLTHVAQRDRRRRCRGRSRPACRSCR